MKVMLSHGTIWCSLAGSICVFRSREFLFILLFRIDFDLTFSFGFESCQLKKIPRKKTQLRIYPKAKLSALRATDVDRCPKNLGGLQSCGFVFSSHCNIYGTTQKEMGYHRSKHWWR